MKVADLKENKDNPRQIPEGALQKLADSIKDFPKMMELRPIVVDADNVVIGGNMRLRALHLLNKKTIPANWVKQASELTDDERTRFIIQDNINSGDWEWDLLSENFDMGSLEDWGLDLHELEVDGDLEGFNRPEFDEPPELEPGKPNKNWLYIEFYHYNDEQFAALTERMSDIMVTAHQLDADSFVQLIDSRGNQEK